MAKRVASWLLALALLALAFEGLAAAYYWIDRGYLPYGGAPAEDGTGGDDAFHVAQAVFHPYTGYVLRATREGTYHGGRWRANNRGFHNLVGADGTACCDYPYGPAEDEIVVGVFGGSVGSGYALSAQIAGGLDALSQIGPWRGKRVTVLNFALPGFKQPQQLMTLAYFLNIGQHFDVVVNIDGFNEAVTTFRNWESGVEPTYPADTLWGAWGRRLEQFDAPAGEKGILLAGYHRLAARGARAAARDSRLASLKLVHEALAGWHQWRRAANEGEALPELTKRAYFPTAMMSPLPPGRDIWRYTADVWARASIAMAGLARRSGAIYLHLLQPNQWDRAGGAYEPIDPEHPYGWVVEPVNRAYPLFRGAAGRLRAAGVRFADLSLLLAGRPDRAVYADDCCHYTEAGYELIFARTVEALREAASRR